ncbi:MAG: UDP-N-acetylmuramoyl-L-alanyl-D-glutamate--2,6-diaminopimelate ligase [Clostridia bacterium]|nr:UDP-N-acetylmuramoyl-L-alanyl-D-glutamate--2,6-diaminopimelate ligase [Clostridia bacterium]
MKIAGLMKDIPVNCRLIGDGETEINQLCTDSRKVTPGCLFFCIPGMHMDAHDFAPEAVKKGAKALVVERELNVACPQILVENVRLAMSYISSRFFSDPSKEMKIIGITGTKGKTTTSFLLKSILEKAGHKVGLIGTVCTLIGDEEHESGKTTPDPVEFQEILRKMADAKCEYVVMEVSAHALAMHRVAGITFEAAGFLNLSLDHLDYFKTMENYLAAKLEIISLADKMIVNVDDERVRDAMEERKVKYTKIGIREKADQYTRNIEITENGLSFKLFFHKRAEMDIALQLTGIFNVYNAMMAASLADSCGIGAEAIEKGLASLKAVPGRIELLDTHTEYRVILDYAHSPDALENILKAVRQTTKGRLIALFGCGGGRDRLKRPVMGRIGGELADLSIITSDNPRNEDPNEIISQITEGIRETKGEYVIIENRREAIRHALTIAEKNDTVVLAGKGHETYQEIMGEKQPFDEKVIVQELLDEIMGGM